jgi:hypothetical protein
MASLALLYVGAPLACQMLLDVTIGIAFVVGAGVAVPTCPDPTVLVAGFLLGALPLGNVLCTVLWAVASCESEGRMGVVVLV